MRSIRTGRQRSAQRLDLRGRRLELPAMGIGVSATSTLDEWARPSPSRTVRAVMTTSNPRRARATAAQRPMPRLAPVTSATGEASATAHLHHPGDLMAAVDVEHLAVHVGRGVAAQEHDDATDVGGRADPTGRIDLGQALLDVVGHLGRRRWR